MARRPTQMTVAEAGLKACMEAQHDAWFSTNGTVLFRDGGPRLKGVNSLKSGKALWGPNPQSNRTTYPYSDPLSIMCS
ncbi:hypothetical protein CRG98_013473 [Punica granatum]|uniref:Uncharacterized protein n=1 Tax=Punica granatum TaxID=22663 RepID=A0A2I0KC40_PUNGR|nr:hypothetical protein CRG98_013473 [Punica granatum]